MRAQGFTPATARVTLSAGRDTEQDVTLALEIADHVYCMLEGRVSLSGTPATLSHTAVTDAYFGVRA